MAENLIDTLQKFNTVPSLSGGGEIQFYDCRDSKAIPTVMIKSENDLRGRINEILENPVTDEDKDIQKYINLRKDNVVAPMTKRRNLQFFKNHQFVTSTKCYQILVSSKTLFEYLMSNTSNILGFCNFCNHP